MDKHAKTYLKHMFIACSLYTGLLIGSLTILKTTDLPLLLSAVVAILPVIPAVAVLFVIVTFVNTRDEVQQRIITESILWGAGIVAIASFTYGFLQNALPLPDISLIWILPALFGVPGLAQLFVQMRYK